MRQGVGVGHRPGPLDQHRAVRARHHTVTQRGSEPGEHRRQGAGHLDRAAGGEARGAPGQRDLVLDVHLVQVGPRRMWPGQRDHRVVLQSRHQPRQSVDCLQERDLRCHIGQRRRLHRRQERQIPGVPSRRESGKGVALQVVACRTGRALGHHYGGTGLIVACPWAFALVHAVAGHHVAGWSLIQRLELGSLDPPVRDRDRVPPQQVLDIACDELRGQRHLSGGRREQVTVIPGRTFADRNHGQILVHMYE